MCAVLPARLYVESQERAVMAQLEGAQQQYQQRMAALLRRQQETEEREVGVHMGGAVDLPTCAGCSELIACKYRALCC